MRITLLLICLFSILGGCAASSSHGVVVPKLIRYSEQHKSSLQFANSHSGGAVFLSDLCISDDIEDDERDNHLFKKIKAQPNTAFALAPLATLSRLHHFRSAPVLLQGDVLRKYIVQRTFRV